MGSSDSSSFSENVAGLIDGASKHRDGVSVDCLPVYVRELIAGGASGGFAKTAVAPLEMIKVLFLTRTEGFRFLGVCGSFKKLTKQEGVQGLYNILRIVPYAAVHYMSYERYRAWLRNNCDLDKACLPGPTLVGILPYAGLKFYIYEELKSRVPEEHQKSYTLHFSCGALAGLFGQTLTYPLDVLRRQIQVENSQHGSARYKNTFDGLIGIMRNQGSRQLFAGLSIKYLKLDGSMAPRLSVGDAHVDPFSHVGCPSVAIGFTLYDYMKSLLHISSEDRSLAVSHGCCTKACFRVPVPEIILMPLY
ncbi:Mitochondrial carrier protein CoAc1-like protein [Drosera capensis]